MPSDGSIARPLGNSGYSHANASLRSARSIGRWTSWLNTPQGGVALLIATTFLARLLLGASMGLGIDESYMAAAGRNLHLGYFDHPPIAWWLVWLAAHLAGPGADLALRLPFIILFGLSTYLMFALTAELFDACAGLWAAALMNAAPVLGFTTGTWVLPDGPLIAALLGMTLCFVRACRAEASSYRWWLGSGACLGLAACSKYTALPIGAGLALFLLTEPNARPWLRRPQPYVAALIAAWLFAPVLLWNADHGWISFLFQGARADGGRWHFAGPLVALAGEALFFLPWIWIALAVCVWRALRHGTAEPRGWLLVCLSVPSILLFEVVSLRGHVLFHWTAPATMLALPLLGNAIGLTRRTSVALRRGLIGTAITVSLGALLVGSEVRFNWLPDVVEDFAMGHDPDLAAVDWASLRTALSRRGELRAGIVVAGTRWLDAGKIDFALRGEVPVVCLGDDPREYGLIAPIAAYAGDDVIIVAPRQTLATISARFGSTFDSIQRLPPVTLLHAGKPAMMLPLFLGHRLHSA